MHSAVSRRQETVVQPLTPAHESMQLSKSGITALDMSFVGCFVLHSIMYACPPGVTYPKPSSSDEHWKMDNEVAVGSAELILGDVRLEGVEEPSDLGLAKETDGVIKLMVDGLPTNALKLVPGVRDGREAEGELRDVEMGTGGGGIVVNGSRVLGGTDVDVLDEVVEDARSLVLKPGVVEDSVGRFVLGEVDCVDRLASSERDADETLIDVVGDDTAVDGKLMLDNDVLCGVGLFDGVVQVPV